MLLSLEDEFENDAESLRAKVRLLVKLLRTSSAVVAYTGSSTQTGRQMWVVQRVMSIVSGHCR